MSEQIKQPKKKPRHPPFVVGPIDFEPGGDVIQITKKRVEEILSTDKTWNKMNEEIKEYEEGIFIKIEDAKIASQMRIAKLRRILKKLDERERKAFKEAKKKRTQAIREIKTMKARRNTYRKRACRAVERQVILALRRKLNIRHTWKDPAWKREIQRGDSNNVKPWGRKMKYIEHGEEKDAG